MQKIATSATLVAGSLAAAISVMPVTVYADDHGFIEDSSLTLNTRQWYSKEIGRGNTYFLAPTSTGRVPVRDRTAWLQGLKLDYVSGYTQGMIGVGLDLSGYEAIALERSMQATAGGSNRLLVDKDGHVVDSWSKMGIAALKLKFSETVVKVGRQQVQTPVMSYSDTRTLPASFDGASVESHDIKGLTIKAGYFDKATPRTGAGSQDLTPSYGTRLVTSDWIGYAGGDYKLDSGPRITAYTSRFKDIWDRQYFGLNNKYRWNDFGTELQFDFYNTQSSGRELAGNIDQQAYGLTVAPSYKNHTLKFGFQQIKGDEYFDYVAESNAVTLPNTMLSYYNGPNERSFQVNYTNDFAAYGLPGFKTILWFIRGWDIDGTHYDGGPNGIYSSVLNQSNESHHEFGSFVSYVVQSGGLKGASVLTGYAWHRASEHQIEGNLDEFRLIVSVPFKIF